LAEHLALILDRHLRINDNNFFLPVSSELAVSYPAVAVAIATRRYLISDDLLALSDEE